MSEVLSSNTFLFETPRHMLEEIISLIFFLSRLFTHAYICIKISFSLDPEKIPNLLFQYFFFEKLSNLHRSGKNSTMIRAILNCFVRFCCSII